MLSSELVSPAVTRRWLHPNVATSNIRNGVGRPWEVYHSSGNDTVLDVLTKTGTIGQYASYFGLTTDFNAGFAILAHDSTVEDRKLDLNVYADEVSEALEHLGLFAAGELQQSLAGTYEGPDKNSVAAFDITKDTGYGLEVQKLTIDGVDMRAQVAEKLGIKLQDLDFRIYPSNVQDESKHQFVAVFQDKSAPVDMGTPTCITWQEVGADFGDVFNFVFELGEKGNGVGFELPQAKGSFKKTT